jgi:hypothetical protein
VGIDSYAGTVLKFYDYRTGTVLRELGGHGIVTSLSSFSPDRTRIAIGAADGTVSLWHPEFGEMTTLSGGGGAGGALAELRNVVGGVTFSPDGTCVASLDWKGTCRIWDVAPLLEREEERRAAARRRYHSREAAALVDELFEELILVSDVVDALARNKELGPDLRDAAITVARVRADDPARLIAGVLRSVLQGGRRPVEYVRALAAAEKAVLLHPREQAYAVSLGAAHYRMGNDREALSALESGEGLRTAPTDMLPALRYLFLALVHQRLNRPDRQYEALRYANRAVAAFETAGGSAEGLRVLRELVQEAE